MFVRKLRLYGSRVCPEAVSVQKPIPRGSGFVKEQSCAGADPIGIPNTPTRASSEPEMTGMQNGEYIYLI